MLEKNTVIIGTNEYEELMKCKMLVKTIFTKCFASRCNDFTDVYFPVDTVLANVLFPAEMKNAKERALKELEAKESEGNK